jgi:hypothetical protein
MTKSMKLAIFLVIGLLEFSLCAWGQQTLGGITGTVTDGSGSVLPDTAVTIVGDQTKLTRSLKTNGSGAYDFVNLPIGLTPSRSVSLGSKPSGYRRSWCRPIEPRP